MTDILHEDMPTLVWLALAVGTVFCGIRMEVSKVIGDLNTSHFMGEVQGYMISRLLRHKFRERIFPFKREVQGT